MSYYDPISLGQITRLYQELRGEQSLIRLIAWGIERQDKGEIIYLNTQGVQVWCMGKFKELIEAVIKNKIDGMRQIYECLAPDFINFYTKEIKSV